MTEKLVSLELNLKSKLFDLFYFPDVIIFIIDDYYYEPNILKDAKSNVCSNILEDEYHRKYNIAHITKCDSIPVSVIKSRKYIFVALQDRVCIFNDNIKLINGILLKSEYIICDIEFCDTFMDITVLWQKKKYIVTIYFPNDEKIYSGFRSKNMKVIWWYRIG